MVKNPTEDLSIRIPFTKEEKDKFNAFVEKKHLNVRRFVRSLIIEAMSQEKANG